MKNLNSMQTLVKASGIFIGLNGFLVVIAWLTGNSDLLQYNHKFPPMQLNTAVCFLLCSLALCNFNSAHTLRLRIIAIIIMAMAAIAGLEFLLNYNLGWECRIFAICNMKLGMHAGRISPISAVDFLFTGIAFFLFGCKKNHLTTAYVITVTFFSSMIVSFALVALLETVTGIGAENLGESVTLMSVHSAVCFIVLGVALIVQAFTIKEDVTSLFPITILFALLTSVFYISYCIKNFEDRRFAESVNNELMHATQEFNLYQVTLYRALDRMRDRWASQGGTQKSWFEADAANYLNDFPTLLGVSFVDADFHITWVMPAKFKKFIGLQYNLEPGRARTIAAVMATHHGQTSSPIRLYSNNMPGFIYMNPLYVKDKFVGLLVATFNAQNSFNTLFKKTLLTQYDLVVTEENTLIFSSLANTKAISNSKWSQNKSFVVNNKVWNFCILPKPELIAEKNSSIPLTVLIAGLLTSLITALAIYFALKAQQTRAQLNWSNDWLQAIVDASHHSIIATDLRGTILQFNHAAERMLGYSAKEMIGKHTPALIHNPQEVGQRALEMSKKLGREIKPGFETFTAKLELKPVNEEEWIYVRKDQSEFPVWLSITPIYVNNYIKGYVGIAQDISERKALEAMKNEFVSIVSHELRTPLTSIQGVLGLMLGGALGEFSSKAHSMLVIAHNNCERLIRLINDILDIEKIAAGKMEFHLATVELNQFAKDAISANQSFADNFGVSLELTVWNKAIFVTADNDRLQQVFANLLSNAIKFSPKGAMVKITVAYAKGAAIIKFRDEGAGIPIAFQKTIFQKFSQADSTTTREKGGTGLGLSISQAIMEKLGGIITYETEINKGTTFIVSLPATEVP